MQNVLDSRTKPRLLGQVPAIIFTYMEIGSAVVQVLVPVKWSGDFLPLKRQEIFFEDSPSMLRPDEFRVTAR